MPRLSLCMPTWNRADMLDYTLRRVIDAYGDQVEIVIADNDSNDHTHEVVRSHMTRGRIVYHKHREVLPYLGQVIALRCASSPFIAFMADDDWIYPNIFEYVEQLERRPELVAIYSDLVAWDDSQEKEQHRYFYLEQAEEYGKGSGKPPLELIRFVCNRLIYPEVGVFRKEAFVRADCLLARGNIPNHLWMYGMSRLGVIRFEAAKNAYYQENRIVKPELKRSEPSNLRFRLLYVGDEFRNALERMMLWAFRDSGEAMCPANQQQFARTLIDNFLIRRLVIEVNRAINDGNFIAAIEFMERYQLWRGDMTGIVMPTNEIVERAMKQAALTLRELLDNKLAAFHKDDGSEGEDGKRVYVDRLREVYGQLAIPILGTGTLSL